MQKRGNFVFVVIGDGLRAPGGAAPDPLTVDFEKIIPVAGDLNGQALRDGSEIENFFHPEVAGFMPFRPGGGDPAGLANHYDGSFSVKLADTVRNIHPGNIFFNPGGPIRREGRLEKSSGRAILLSESHKTRSGR